MKISYIRFMEDGMIDYAIAVFKIGDQDSKTPYLDGELIEVIDPNEQVLGWTLSDRMQTIFYCRKIALDKKGQYRGYVRDLEKPHKPKCILRPDKLTGEEQLILRDKNSKKPIKEIDEAVFDYGDNLPANPSALDENAWVGGDVTVGSGGDYATWVLLTADLGTFTSSGTAVQISGVTEASVATFSLTIGIYDICLNGSGHTTNAGHNNEAIQFIATSTTGVIEIYGMVLKRTVSTVPATKNLIYVPSTNNSNVIIRDNICDGNGLAGSGVRVSSVSKTIHIYNTVCYDLFIGFQLLVTSSTLIVENCAAYNNVFSVNSIGFQCSGQTLNLINCASFDNTLDYANTASLTAFSKSASSDATGSEVGLQSLTAATVFQSLVDTDPNFLFPVKDEALYGAGVDPTIAGHTTYYNGVPILLGDVDIGANGLLRVAPSTGRTTGKRLYNKLRIGV